VGTPMPETAPVDGALAGRITELAQRNRSYLISRFRTTNPDYIGGLHNITDWTREELARDIALAEQRINARLAETTEIGVAA